MGKLVLKSRHRLMCGDSTKSEDVAKLLDGEVAHCIFTDPPYGVGYEYHDHDDSDIEAYWQLVSSVFGDLACPCVTTVGHKHNNEWFARFRPDSFLVWFDKTKQSPHRDAYLCKSELVLVFGKLPNKYAWDTFEIQADRGDGMRELHTCPKPLSLFKALIEPQEVNLIYDPFLGSGTTMIAAEQLGRRCFGMEISAAYCDVGVQRWENLTGKKAVRISAEEPAESPA